MALLCCWYPCFYSKEAGMCFFKRFTFPSTKIDGECKSFKKEHLALIGQHLLIVDVLSLSFERMIETWGKAVKKSPNAVFQWEKMDYGGLIFIVHFIDWLGIIALLGSISSVSAVSSKLLRREQCS